MSIEGADLSAPVRESGLRGAQHRASGIACKNHRKYSLTCSDFEELWNRSGGVCEACGSAGRVPFRDLVIDHDHRYGLGAVRGLICRRCNQLLGMIEQPSLNPPFGPSGPGRHFATYLGKAWFAGNAPGPQSALDCEAVLREVSTWRRLNSELFDMQPDTLQVPRSKPVVIAKALREELSPQAFAALIRVMEDMASVPKRLPS